MNYEVEFDPGAEQDLVDAFAWYEQQSEGLGTEFLRQIMVQKDRLARNPQIHAIEYADIRRAFLGRFPYALHFQIEDRKVRVLACLHFRRSPTRWPGTP